ncbi:hypothetical protein NDU88_005687 [Pleurodeles waltl]|uniref:Prolactin receptor n=1 Tax=Pleurodeles waltl TaxID=8319 RepID=A0AAV7TBG8_PLEWA|nr:hypothetical protein NDU88_005687 [Pleurodeles waltl]
MKDGLEEPPLTQDPSTRVKSEGLLDLKAMLDRHQEMEQKSFPSISDKETPTSEKQLSKIDSGNCDATPSCASFWMTLRSEENATVNKV